MSRELPAGWTTAALSDCVLPVPSLNPADTPDTEFTYCDISAIDNEAGVVVAPKVLVGRDAPSRARQAVRAGDVLFSTVRPGLRAIARVPEMPNPVASTGFCVLRPAEGVDGSLLLHLLRSHDFLQQVLPLQRGVSYPAVRDADVLGQLVPVPPAAEQSRIVAKLEELLSDLDAGVAELKAAQAKLQHYRQSLLKAAVEGSLTHAWREVHPAPEETGADLLARILRERRARWEAQQLAKFEAQGKKPPKGWQANYVEPVRPEIDGLPLLPINWTWASLEQIAADEKYSLAIGPFGSNLTVPDYRDAGVPLVFVRNIRSGQFGGQSTRYVTPEKARELTAHEVAAGDVLITKMGEPPGDACVYPADQPLAIITADCIKVRCAEGLMQPKFLEAVVNSYIGKEQIKPMTQGVAQKKVSLGRFSKLAVPVPPPEEQTIILSKLIEAEQEALCLEDALAQSLRHSTAQRQNLLRAAFAGQLVPQDPADEPATALLARIRAERAAASPVRRGRRAHKTSEPA